MTQPDVKQQAAPFSGLIAVQQAPPTKDPKHLMVCIIFATAPNIEQFEEFHILTISAQTYREDKGNMSMLYFFLNIAGTLSRTCEFPANMNTDDGLGQVVNKTVIKLQH